MKLKEKLLAIQTELKAPKGQYNSFGKYKYRSCEDVLESLKPLLCKNKVILTFTDEPVVVGTRFYIMAVASLSDVETDEVITVTAYAREDESKKGMDGSQVTGTASSYARKYALNAMFCIDDTKDADTNEFKTITQENKEYKCVDCGKKFESFTDKNGKSWNAGQVYHMAEKSNKDGKARCKACRTKFEKENKDE